MLLLSVGGLNRKITASVVQPSCVSGSPPRGSYQFFALECSVGYFFDLVRRGSPIELSVWGPPRVEAGHIIFAPETPHVSRGWVGPELLLSVTR